MHVTSSPSDLWLWLNFFFPCSSFLCHCATVSVKFIIIIYIIIYTHMEDVIVKVSCSLRPKRALEQ